MTTHPSFFELDAAALGQPTPAVKSHLTSCTECQAYLQKAKHQDLTVPSWAVSPSSKTPWLRLLGFTAMIFLTGAGVWRLTAETKLSSSETRSKGQPAFAFFVEKGGTVTLWNGREAVEAGERLQLKVASSGFSFLRVAVKTDNTWKQLFAGAVNPTGETTLPESWLVDAADRHMQLGLLLCSSECDEADFARAVSGKFRNEKFWFSEFTLMQGKAP